MKNILRVIFILIFSFNFAMAINAYFSDINGVKIIESFIPESNTDFNISIDSNITSEANLTCEFIDITTSNDDFTHGNVTISFEVNQTHTTMPLTIVSDTIYEDNETFTMKLRDSNNTLLHEINVTILNNDSLPSISIANNSFAECNATSKTYIFPITINNKTDRNMSFDINSTEASADSLDFNSINQTFIIESNEWSLDSITKDLNITILCDSVYENNESFNLKISNIVNASSTQSEANITIIEDEPIPTVTIVSNSTSKSEDSGENINFTFDLSPISKFDINISLDINKTFMPNGFEFLIANEGSDYTLSTYNINFPSGSNQSELNISILNDSYYEFNENMRFDLNLTGEANLTNGYIEANISQDSDPELIVSQSLKDGANLNNIFVTDMVEFNISVKNNSEYNMSNIEIWDDIDISLEKNTTSLSNGTFNTYKVIGQANGYMFNILSLQKDETKYLYIDVNVTEPISPNLINDKINYSNLVMDNNHSTFTSGDIYRISEFSNSVSVDTNFTETNINNTYLNYPQNSFEANSTFYAKQYLMDIKVLKDTNLSKDYLELNDTLGFTIDVNNEYTFTPEIANGLLLGDTISDALILPDPLDGLNNLYGYYIFNLEATNTKALKFDTTPKQSGNIAGIYSTTINCAEVVTMYNKRFYDFNLTNNKDCVELNNSTGLLIKGDSNEAITIKGYEFDGCSLNSRGTSTHPHVSSSIVNATLSKGKYPIGDTNYDGEGGKYCFGATINTNSYIVVNDMLSEGNGTFDTLSQLTVTNWFYPKNLSNANDERVILSRENSYYLTVKETGTTSDKLSFYIHKNNFSQNTLDLIQTIYDTNSSVFSNYFSQSGNYYKFEFNTTINPDSWYYLGFLYDGNSSSNISDINLSDPNTISSTCPTGSTAVEPLVCKKKGSGSGNDKIYLRFCNKGALHGKDPSNNSTYLYHDIDKISGFPHYLFYCGDDNVSGDTIQLYLVQENGSLAPSTNPFANFLPKELINNTSNFYMYKDNDNKIGITGYAENIEIYFNQSLEQTIIDNFNNYNTTLDDNNKKECRLCSTSNPKDYSKIFDTNVSGDSTIIGASILTNTSSETKNDTATMSINNTNSQDNLNLGQKLELPNSSEILFAKLYWQGAILFDSSKKYIKELYSPDRNIDLYKNISFYINDVNTTLNSNDINCSWFRPAKYVYNKAKPVTYDCNGSWYSPTGNTGSSSHNRVCLGDLIKIPATNAIGSVSFMAVKDALYYQCSIDVTNQVSPNATYKVTDILTTTSNSNEYEGVGGTFGGWALSVAYDNNAKKFKRVTLFDGFKALNNNDRIIDNFTFTYPFLVDGFETNESGDVNASLILFASEGDNGVLGDTISINGKSSAYLNNNDPLNSTLKNSFDKTYLGLDIDKFDLTNEINNSESEANISLNIQVNETTTEADNYFLGFIGLNSELGEDVCYETEVKKVGSTSFKTFANLGKVKETDELIFKVNATNRGFYSNYLAINKFLEENSSLEFECISDIDGNCITPTPNYADITTVGTDINLTFKLGNGVNSNSGGFLSKGVTSSDIYFKAKVNFYKNGHEYLFDYDKYRYRDKNITTFENLGYCTNEPKLDFEDLSLSISSYFTPTQIFKDELSDFNLTTTVKNLSSFPAHDLNLTINFPNLSSFGKTLSDLNPIWSNPNSDWDINLTFNNYSILFELKSDKNLSKNILTTFIIDFNTTFNNSGILQATSTINSTMEETKSSTAYLSIAELIAEYKFDECFWGSDGSNFDMIVVDSENGDYNATAMNEANTTDIKGKVCRSGYFDGINDYINVGDTFNDIFGSSSNQFTITTWLYPTILTNTQTNHSTKNTFIAKASDNYNDNLEIGVNTDGSLHLYLDVENSDTSVNKGSGVNANEWSFVAITYNGYEKKVTLNIDGNSYEYIHSSGNIANATGSPFTIGNTLHGASGTNIDNHFTGYIDEVKIYKGALTAENINAIYSSEVNPSRSCPICYPKKYEFISDGNGTCGDTSGENITLNLLNEDNSSFVFIDSSSANYQDKYPTLNYFDLNITTNAKEANITNLNFQVINSNTLPSIVRANSPSSGIFKFNNPCKDTSGNRCSEALDVTFNVNNILQSPVVGDYTIKDNGFLNYSLVTRMMYFKVGGSNYSDYPKEVEQIKNEPLMDKLGNNYNFYMEFNESDTGKAITLSGVSDSTSYQNLIETGFNNTKENLISTTDTITNSNAPLQNITFTTLNNKLGLSTATIKVENSNNFCADGTYSIEVLTKPDSFQLDLDSKFLYLTENREFLAQTSLKYDENLSLNIMPICSGGVCGNNLKNLSNFLGNDKTTYFTEINATDTTNGSAINIDINQSAGNAGSYHKTEWKSDGNFTKLYFNNNSLDSAIYYNDTNNKLVDLNFTISYFRLFNRDGSLSGSSKYGYAIYGGGIPAKFIKGPDHIRVGYNEGEQKCGREFYLTLYPEDDNNDSVDWGGYQIEIVLNNDIFWIDGWNKNGNTYSFTTSEGNSSSITAYIISETSSCCPYYNLKITNVILNDDSGNPIADFSSNLSGVYANYPEKDPFTLSCPAYSFLALENNTTISPTLDDNNVSGTDRNITTKIANNNLNFILISYWDENDTLIDFDTKLVTFIVDNSNNQIYPTLPNTPMTISLSDTNKKGYATWDNINISNAYRFLQVRMEEEHNRTHFDISDPFAIRPKNFTLSVPLTATARAGEEFNMNLSAVDSGNNNINNYNECENINRSFKIDVNLTHNGVFNQIDLSLSDDFNYTNEGSISFSSGKIQNLSTAILEVGRFDINITDGNGSYENSPTNCSGCVGTSDNCTNQNGCPYACIDITNNSCSGLSTIDMANGVIVITPFEYNITSNFNPTSWIYMGGVNENNYVEINATVVAQNILHQTTQNFTSLIFTNTNPNSPNTINVNADINLTINNTNQEFNVNGSKIINADLINPILENSQLTNSDTNLTPIFNLSSNPHFLNGEANISYKFNIDRNVSKALNPIQFTLRDINTTNNPSTYNSADNLGYSGLSTQNVTFYYGRIYSPDYEVDKSIQPFPITINGEVYINSSGNDYANIQGVNTYYGGHWYRNIGDSTSQVLNLRANNNDVRNSYDGNITRDSGGSIFGDITDTGSINLSSGKVSIDVYNTLDSNNNNFPHKTRFFLNVANYLWYEPYPRNGINTINDGNDSYSQPSFSISFTDSSTNDKWSDTEGKTLDSNTSAIRRIEW